MHVVESDNPKSAVAAESPDKGLSAVTTTVDDAAPASDVISEVKPDSPKANGVCDSAGERPKGRGKESPEIRADVQSPALNIKEEPGTEPQDLTVTCTSSLDTQPKAFPSAKYISISVEQCQVSTSPSSHKSKSNPARKRSAKSSDSDESNHKRGRKMDEREAAVSQFVDQASSGSIEDLQRHAECIQQEIHGLSALARTKEYEWNEIIRTKKLKEEIYLRLIRKKQIMMINIGVRPPDDQTYDFTIENRLSDLVTNDQVSLNKVKRLPSNLTITKSSAHQSGASQQLQRFLMQSQRVPSDQQQPIGNGSGSPQRHRSSSGKGPRPCPILPKPSQANLDNQSSSGRQGSIVDVKSIIADYRQSHPETIPRRGRRMKGAADNTVTSSRGVLNMSSIALGSGSQVRTVGSTSGPDETSRPSSADSSRSDAMNLKDVYVQYAKHQNNSKAQPPPYPEVTLHPVLPGASQSPPPPTSLLHGILTKQPASGRAANATGAFSSTLAKLLTTPDRPSTTTTITTALRGNGTSSSNATAPVSITELLSTSKSRNELTITPVVSNAQPAKREEPVTASQQDEDGEDRLVIDEGEDTENDPPEAAPECQGCHLKPAQFVCAGCGNQWYCSRNCQVNAWDEHSEVCAG